MQAQIRITLNSKNIFFNLKKKKKSLNDHSILGFGNKSPPRHFKIISHILVSVFLPTELRELQAGS